MASFDQSQNKPAGPAWPQLAVDLGLPLALAVVLLVIYAIDRPGPKPNVTVPLEPTVSAAPHALVLGVTPAEPAYDDMGKLLTDLGEGYKFEPFSMRDLEDPAKLEKYDVIFLTCSGVPDAWLGTLVGDAARANTREYTPNREMLSQVYRSLGEFLSKGKTLYVSDWHLEVLASAFRDDGLLDNQLADVSGAEQEVEAEVTDKELADLLKTDRLRLNFDQPDWKPAAFREDKVKVYLRGTFETDGGRRVTAPLLVKFPWHGGTVIFTSFHNEKQNSEVEKDLLNYLVFSAVLARADTEQEADVGAGGVSTNLGIFTTANASADYDYECTKQEDLRFRLVFPDQGAELKLTLVGPDGKRFEKSGTSTLSIEVPSAAVGKWKCTVQAVKVPHANFPYRIKVGKKPAKCGGADV